MPPAPTKYTDLISSSVMTFMFFYASIYLQAKVTIIFGSLAEYLGFFNVCFCTAYFRGTRQEANRRMPRHGRRQTYFETPGPHRDATPCLFPRTRPMPASERGSRRKRTWGLMQSYLGAETNASGSRDERVWDLIRARLGAEALTKIGFELAEQVFCFQGDMRNP